MGRRASANPTYSNVVKVTDEVWIAQRAAQQRPTWYCDRWPRCSLGTADKWQASLLTLKADQAWLEDAECDWRAACGNTSHHVSFKTVAEVWLATQKTDHAYKAERKADDFALSPRQCPWRTHPISALDHLARYTPYPCEGGRTNPQVQFHWADGMAYRVQFRQTGLPMPAAPEATTSSIETLIDLVQRLSLATSQSEITAIVTRAIRRLTDADGATFVFKEGECCYYADEDAIAPLWQGRRFPLAQCISGWTMNNGRTTVIEDVRDDERIPQSAYRPTFVRSLAMAPVRTNTSVAAIGAYWATPKPPKESDVTMLQAIAHAAALALQNLDLVTSLKAAAEAKARLLTAVGHDLRQPLQSLALFAGVLEGEATTPAARAAAGQINTAVDRMANLLGSILALGELGGGAVPVNRSKVAVDTVLAPLEAEMAPQAEAKGIHLRRVPCSAPISTDPGLLIAILRNLVANSIRYTERGRVIMGARRQGDDIILIVGDTGMGIAAAKQAVIFEEFYQIGNSARDFGSGTGVGLAMVQRLVDILGHRIQVRSIEGRGSVFSVTVPAA